MFKIGDFSKLGQVSTRMLRHYDQMGLLRPSQTDEWTGYRYYTIDQLARLHRIIALKELGFSLEQVANLLTRGDALPVQELRGMLKLRQAEISRELQEKQTQLIEVETRLQQLEQEGHPSPYEIVVKSLETQTLASIRQVVPHIAEMPYYCQALYTQLYATLKRHKITPLEPEVTLYHNDEYQETELDVEVALPVASTTLAIPDELVVRELPGAELAAAGPVRARPRRLRSGSGTGGRPVDGPDERRGRGPAHDGGRTPPDRHLPGPRGEPGPGRGVLPPTERGYRLSRRRLRAPSRRSPLRPRPVHPVERVGWGLVRDHDLSVPGRRLVRLGSGAVAGGGQQAPSAMSEPVPFSSIVRQAEWSSTVIRTLPSSSRPSSSASSTPETSGLPGILSATSLIAFTERPPS